MRNPDKSKTTFFIMKRVFLADGSYYHYGYSLENDCLYSTIIAQEGKFENKINKIFVSNIRIDFQNTIDDIATMIACLNQATNIKSLSIEGVFDIKEFEFFTELKSNSIRNLQFGFFKTNQHFLLLKTILTNNQQIRFLTLKITLVDDTIPQVLTEFFNFIRDFNKNLTVQLKVIFLDESFKSSDILKEFIDLLPNNLIGITYLDNPCNIIRNNCLGEPTDVFNDDEERIVPLMSLVLKNSHLKNLVVQGVHCYGVAEPLAVSRNIQKLLMPSVDLLKIIPNSTIKSFACEFSYKNNMEKYLEGIVNFTGLKKLAINFGCSEENVFKSETFLEKLLVQLGKLSLESLTLKDWQFSEDSLEVLKTHLSQENQPIKQLELGELTPELAYELLVYLETNPIKLRDFNLILDMGYKKYDKVKVLEKICSLMHSYPKFLCGLSHSKEEDFKGNPIVFTQYLTLHTRNSTICQREIASLKNLCFDFFSKDPEKLTDSKIPVPREILEEFTVYCEEESNFLSFGL